MKVTNGLVGPVRGKCLLGMAKIAIEIDSDLPLGVSYLTEAFNNGETQAVSNLVTLYHKNE